jgi:tetratricopeptide (TPR) repeat protein
MKRALAILPAAVLLLPGAIFAQVIQNNGGGGGAPPAQQPQGGNVDNSPPPQQQGGKDPLLGGALPFADVGNETVQWDGKMWNVTNNRMFRARLEKYLASPEADTPEDEAYRKVLDEITQQLNPTYNGGKPNLPGAVALLPAAAQFPIDAKLCDTLANAIYGVWLSTKNVTNLRASVAEMERRKNNNYFFGAHEEAPSQKPQAAPRAGAKGAPPRPQSATSDLTHVVQYTKDIVELEAKIKASELSMGTAQVAAKAEFQAIIIQFAIQRRFEHVVLACRFYRHLFADPSGILKLKEGSDAEKMFASSMGTSPTVSALDSFANEAIRDVDEAVQAFDNLVQRGDLASASQRISEAFMVGEYLPRVRRVPMEKKMTVMDFTRDANQLVSCMEVKDYTRAEELVTKMLKTAKDFDASKPLAAINTAKTVSEMQLNKAKAAIMQSDQKAATEALTAAVQTWPTNPRLKEFNEMTGRVADVKTQAVMDFDKLLGQKNYRQIFNDQGRYSAAVMDDTKRQSELADVLTKINKLLVITSGANSLLQQGNNAGAWETIEKAYEEFPDDMEVSRMRSDLSVKASEFVGALQKAKQHEERQQIGSALAWYLKARTQYPPSSFASDGVNRQVEKLKNGVGSGG